MKHRIFGRKVGANEFMIALIAGWGSSTAGQAVARAGSRPSRWTAPGAPWLRCASAASRATSTSRTT